VVLREGASPAHSQEIKLTIDVKVVDRIVLERCVVQSGFEAMLALLPAKRIVPNVRVVDEPGGAIRAEADGETIIAKAHASGASGVIGRKADAQFTGRWELARGDGL